MKIEVLRKKPLWELKVIIKALSQPISSFLNTDEDNERLENTRRVLKERNGYEIHWKFYLDYGNNNACHYILSSVEFNMSQLQIKTNIENGDLPKDFNKKELEPIPFGNVSLTLNDILNLPKFTELLKGNKKD